MFETLKKCIFGLIRPNSACKTTKNPFFEVERSLCINIKTIQEDSGIYVNIIYSPIPLTVQTKTVQCELSGK